MVTVAFSVSNVMFSMVNVTFLTVGQFLVT